MHDLDETDVQILSLLSENARRPFSEIGEVVGLSGPAVSDRVTRLQEAGVIRGFRVEVDRTKLDAAVPVLVRLELPADAVAAVRERLRESARVDHVFLTAEGALLFYARAAPGGVHAWVEDLVGDAEPTARSVTLVDEAEWTPDVEGADLALSCVECGNTVDSEGTSVRLDGAVYHFCCDSCRERFQRRYERLREDAD
jgi:DNA-binding Lrp family transcriptional regulator